MRKNSEGSKRICTWIYPSIPSRDVLSGILLYRIKHANNVVHTIQIKTAQWKVSVSQLRAVVKDVCHQQMILPLVPAGNDDQKLFSLLVKKSCLNLSKHII